MSIPTDSSDSTFRNPGSLKNGNQTSRVRELLKNITLSVAGIAGGAGMLIGFERSTSEPPAPGTVAISPAEIAKELDSSIKRIFDEIDNPTSQASQILMARKTIRAMFEKNPEAVLKYDPSFTSDQNDAAIRDLNYQVANNRELPATLRAFAYMELNEGNQQLPPELLGDIAKAMGDLPLTLTTEQASKVDKFRTLCLNENIPIDFKNPTIIE